MASDVEVVKYDGQSFVSLSGKVGKDGVIKTSGPIQSEFASDVCVQVRPGLLFLPVSDIALRSESDFHQTRRRVVLRQLFEPATDLFNLLRQGAIIAALILAVICWWQMSSLAGEVGKIGGQMDGVVSKLNSLPASSSSSSSSSSVPNADGIKPIPGTGDSLSVVPLSYKGASDVCYLNQPCPPQPRPGVPPTSQPPGIDPCNNAGPFPVGIVCIPAGSATTGASSVSGYGAITTTTSQFRSWGAAGVVTIMR